jgi:hypothetical protein
MLSNRHLHLVIVVYVIWLVIEVVALEQQRDITRRRFVDAQTVARHTKRPLLVIGNPDASLKNAISRDYTCGDICIDLHGCTNCTPTTVILKEDVVHALGRVKSDSVVVFESCVLAYVRNRETAESEMLRVAGASSRIFSVDLLPQRLYTRAMAQFQHLRYENQWFHFGMVSLLFHLVIVAPLVVTYRASNYANYLQSPHR